MKEETPLTKNASDDVKSETKTGKASSIKSGDLSGERRRSKNSKSKDELRTNSKEQGKPRSSILTFAQIKVRCLVDTREMFSFVFICVMISVFGCQEERERHRLKEKERILRMEERRRHMEREHQREIERRQREEAAHLERYTDSFRDELFFRISSRNDVPHLVKT